MALGEVLRRRQEADDRRRLAEAEAEKRRHTSDEYAYDIYVSYARDLLTSGWIQEFMKRVTWRLRQSDYDAKLFFDIREIEVEELWDLQIKEPLSRSKILMAFLTPRYFTSAWSVAEWMTFEERERLVWGPSPKTPIILPLRLYGGENYPEWARRRRSSDVTEYLSSVPRLWDTEKAFELESKVIAPLSGIALELLAKAPPWDATWPVIDPSDVRVESPKSPVSFPRTR
jgi:hypothetical protein